MAIKGLIPQLAERGKIKCGGLGDKRKKQGKDEYYRLPVKHDHFTITTLQRNEAGDLIPDKELMKLINPEGGKLTEIPVRLLYNDPELNFPTRLACYKGTRAWCTGDGEWAKRLGEGKIPDENDPLSERQAGPNEYGLVKCPCERWKPDYDKPDKCKTLGTLQVLIEGMERIGGVWKFRTTSYNSVTNLLSSMQLIRQITGGRLAGLPLKLVLSPKTVTTPTEGKTMVVFVASIEYQGNIEDLRKRGYNLAKEEIEHQISMNLLEDQARRTIIPPHEEPESEQRTTAEEFFPDATVVDAQITTVGAQEPPGEKITPPPDVAPTTDPKPPATEHTESQAAGNKAEHAQGQGFKKAMTFPQLMNAIKVQEYIEFPQPLMTSKGVELGKMVDRFFAEDIQTLILELRPDMPEVAGGLTQELISKRFKPAGIEILFQPPGTFAEGSLKKEEAGASHSELEGLAQTDQAQAPGHKGNGGKRALF